MSPLLAVECASVKRPLQRSHRGTGSPAAMLYLGGGYKVLGGDRSTICQAVVCLYVPGCVLIIYSSAVLSQGGRDLKD